MKDLLLDPEDEHLRVFCCNVANGYVQCTHSGVRLLLHRLLTNCPDGMVVDHKDKNKKNNRKDNLRICTTSQNLANTDIASSNTSGYKGVSWHKDSKKWRATIQVNSKQIHLGNFLLKETAAIEYNKAAVKYFKEFAQLNEVPDNGSQNIKLKLLRLANAALLSKTLSAPEATG